LKEQEGFLVPTEYIKRELKQSTSKTEHQGSKERKKGAAKKKPTAAQDAYVHDFPLSKGYRDRLMERGK
jgi:hypothetical protein